MSVCPTCSDNRFVTVRVEARRYNGEGGPSHVYPCPICGQFVHDVDGKKYGRKDTRYGNPTIRDFSAYASWKLRNAAKQEGWHLLPLMKSEELTADQFRREYPNASQAWINAWVLGGRKVHVEQELDDPEYDPRKDPEFLVIAEQERERRIKEQAALLHETRPEWWRRMEKGEPVELNDFQKRLAERWQRQEKVKAFLDGKQTP